MHSSSDLSHRWPRPDPDDPLAPLWILRGQSSPCSQSICTLPSGTCLDSGTSLSSISSRLEHPSAPNATPLTVLPNVRDRRRRPKDPAPSQTSFRAHVADTFSHLSTTYLFRPKDASTKDVVRPASIADSGWFETLSDDRPRTPPHLSPRGRKAYRASQFRARADEPPTMTQLHHAASLKVFDADGRAVRFGKLWEDKRTIVCFIRHFLYATCFFFASFPFMLTHTQVSYVSRLYARRSERGDQRKPGQSTRQLGDHRLRIARNDQILSRFAFRSLRVAVVP